MISGSINARMMAVATLPVSLVVACIVFVFWFGRSNDLMDAHTQRGRLLSRQVALASELSVFSGDIASLQGIIHSVQREPDVVKVQIFDHAGVLLAGTNPKDAGASAATVPEDAVGYGLDTYTEPVVASRLPLDDLYAAPSTAAQPPTQVLGYVVLVVSRASLDALEQRTLAFALLIAAVGILAGALIAHRMGRGVVDPVMRVSRMVNRIGHGDFSLEQPVNKRDPLYTLQVALDQMATRLAWGRDELEQRVEQATRELRIKKEEAEVATRAKSRFLAAASHDLRQPTHALGLFVTRLGQLNMADDARQVVSNLETSVQAMQDLLDGLLDLSRLDAGSIQASVQPLSMDAILGETHEILEPLAAERGLTLRMHCNGLWGLSDPLLLRRMVLNLGQNAVRYTPRGSILLASRVCQQGQSVCVEVWDSGIGIALEHQQDIFQEFYQVGNRARDRRQGLGLGLSIVQRSADLLGHRIAVRSQPGCGARFSIILPRTAPVTEHRPAIPAATDQDIEGMQVLVIEDDPLAMQAVESLLQSWGCKVSAVASVEEACVRVSGGVCPDVVLSDYRLQGRVNGMEAIQMLQTMTGKSLPACLMSGDTDADLMQQVRHRGLTLLHKPVRPAKLRSLLRSLRA